MMNGKRCIDIDLAYRYMVDGDLFAAIEKTIHKEYHN
jgi:hypothetical protein